MTPSPPRDRQGFEIALICALEVEANAVHAVFDKFWDDDEKDYGQAPGDNNAYTTGVVGEHNVVLAYMPGMGKANAASVAASLRSSFPNITLAMVVGICGGVPMSNFNEEIYLGDLVISTALVQYDFGRQYPTLFERKDTLEDNLGRPSAQIRNVLAKLKTWHYRQKLQNRIVTFLQDVQAKMPEMRYPGIEKDQLYKPSYLHKHHSTSAAGKCGTCNSDGDQICQAALKVSCHQLGCEAAELVLRSGRADTSESEGHKPVIHFGKMGSADTVMKSGIHRDTVAEADQIIAFEMEGAGVWDHFPSIIVKGVCDYADSHKHKAWQGHAAAVAAAGMKALLKEWRPRDTQSGPDSQSAERQSTNAGHSGVPATSTFHNQGPVSNQAGVQTVHGSMYSGPVHNQSATFGDGPNYGAQTGFNYGTVTNNFAGRQNTNDVHHDDRWKVEFDEQARKLNLRWRESIVDLLKLLRLDSSLEARVSLAEKLNVRAGKHGSAEQNVALHAAMMHELANNGGKVPQRLVTG